MKRLILVAIPSLLLVLITGCKKDESQDEVFPVINKGDIRFTRGRIIAPSCTILSKGLISEDKLNSTEDQLVAIKYDSTWYFFCTGLKDSTCTLSDSLSRLSMATFIARKLQTKQKADQRTNFDWELPTGMGVDEVTLNENYRFTNFKVRWAAVDNGDKKFYLAPKELISISLMEMLESGKLLEFNVQSSKEVPFAGHEYKTYGSVVRAWAIAPAMLLIDYRNLSEACASDMELVAKINTVEFIEILLEGITEIIGDIPVIGDCINACIEPVFMLIKGLAYDLLIGKEAAREAFKSSADAFIMDLGSCLVSVCSGESLEAVREALDLISTLAWAGMAVIGAFDAATSKYFNSFAPPGVKILVPGPCETVWDLYPPGTTLTGRQARGYTGDFDCWSDIYTEHGVRISPWFGDGRAYYDYGPVNQGSVAVSFQWVDNAWWSDVKAVEVYNWKTDSWDRIASWSGNDGLEHSDSYGFSVTSETKGPRGQVRVAIFAASSSVIHLNSITVN